MCSVQPAYYWLPSWFKCSKDKLQPTSMNALVRKCVHIGFGRFDPVSDDEYDQTKRSCNINVTFSVSRHRHRCAWDGEIKSKSLQNVLFWTDYVFYVEGLFFEILFPIRFFMTFHLCANNANWILQFPCHWKTTQFDEDDDDEDDDFDRLRRLCFFDRDFLLSLDELLLLLLLRFLRLAIIVEAAQIFSTFSIRFISSFSCSISIFNVSDLISSSRAISWAVSVRSFTLACRARSNSSSSSRFCSAWRRTCSISFNMWSLSCDNASARLSIFSFNARSFSSPADSVADFWLHSAAGAQSTFFRSSVRSELCSTDRERFLDKSSCAERFSARAVSLLSVFWLRLRDVDRDRLFWRSFDLEYE